MQAAAADIQRQVVQSAAQTESNFQITNLNLNSSIRDITNAASNSMQYAAKPSSGLGAIIGGAAQGLFNTADRGHTEPAVWGVGSISGAFSRGTTTSNKKAFTGSFSF